MVSEGIDHKSSDIFRLANQMRKENVDVVGDKPVKNDTGEMSMSKEAKQNVWAEHYKRLLNVEFDWDPDHLSNEPPLEGPPIPITIDMVKRAISKMKSGKTAGPSGIVVEMIKAAGDTGATIIRDLDTAIILDGKVPTDWEESFIVCLYKGKGDAYPYMKKAEFQEVIFNSRKVLNGMMFTCEPVSILNLMGVFFGPMFTVAKA